MATIAPGRWAPASNIRQQLFRVESHTAPGRCLQRTRVLCNVIPDQPAQSQAGARPQQSGPTSRRPRSTGSQATPQQHAGKPQQQKQHQSGSQQRSVQEQAAVQVQKQQAALKQQQAASAQDDDDEAADEDDSDSDDADVGFSEQDLMEEEAEEPKVVQPLTKRERHQVTTLLASLDLPQELTAALLAAAEQQLIPRDAPALGDQLKSLLLHSKGAAKLLTAASAAAAALGLTLPQVLGITAAAPLLISMPVAEMQHRVDKLAEAVKVSKPAAAQLVAGNAALLAVPPEPLAAKLALLSRTVGLSHLQATKMVTVYMFPDVRWA